MKAQYHEGLKDAELKQERLKADQAIVEASKNYHQNYLDRHCNIKVLPGLMKEGKPLSTIYTAVKFLRDSDLRYFSTLDNLEDLYRQAGNRRFRVGENERQDGLEVANQEQYLMVLGGPGVGKSTFLRKLGLDALEGRLAHSLMPVFIELKSFKNQEMSLLQAIAGELKNRGFPYSENLVESMLSDGKMLVLFDGLDEVPSAQVDTVIEQIKNFCDQYQQNRFVTSCRVAAYKGGFNRFTDVTMAEFDNEQIEQFVRRWFSSKLDEESGTADRFWEMLQQDENTSAKELAQTPLLLTFLCLVYDRSQVLPPVRSTLYGKALDILLEDWAAEKRLERDPIYQGLHTDLEKELLSEIAYQSFEADQLFFSEQEITERITEFLAGTLDAPKYLDGAAVLKAIEVQQGVLVERATDTYSFSHLTLQEYLAAQYISSQWFIEEIVTKHLTDERWREVFLLVSGLVRGRSQELWLAMEQQANTFISSLKLQGLLQWAMNLSDSSLPNNQILASRVWLLYSAITVAAIVRARARAILRAIVRARAIGNAIGSNSDSGKARTTRARARARARDFAVRSGDSKSIFVTYKTTALIREYAFVNSNASISAEDFARVIANAIANAIDSASASDIDYEALSKKLEDLKEQLPSDDATADKWQNFADQLLEIFLTFFHLDRDLITFSLEEAQALEKYLYSVKLIIDCKKSAVRVSRKEWEAIESRLLTVPAKEGE
ncbi:MAG: NACHT domain-containing protein [Leptolyngbya sp. SIO3F4]|nr:NACHT domain-containing protein [Leptolyngbya sp. SIO3F4]